MSASYPLVRNFRAFSTRAGVLISPSRSGSSWSSLSSLFTRSCILVLYISILGQPVLAQTPDADALYADRANLASAREAARLYEADLERHAAAFDTAWKLARVCYWLGGHAPQP